MPSNIEWLQGGESYNPITGCTKISPGCRSCYAERMAKRLAGRFGYPVDEPFRVTFHEDKLAQPVRWRKSRNIFCISMGDMFHPEVEFEWLEQIFAVMKAAKQHRYFILTKRPARMCDLLPRLIRKKATPHIFYGVSAENQETLNERMKFLLKVDGRIFVSLEPLLSPIHLSREHLIHLDWVIAGSESGPNARASHYNWFRKIRDECIKTNVPFFFKQIITLDGKISMPHLDGKRWIQQPK